MRKKDGSLSDCFDVKCISGLPPTVRHCVCRKFEFWERFGIRDWMKRVSKMPDSEEEFVQSVRMELGSWIQQVNAGQGTAVWDVMQYRTGVSAFYKSHHGPLLALVCLPTKQMARVFILINGRRVEMRPTDILFVPRFMETVLPPDAVSSIIALGTTLKSWAETFKDEKKTVVVTGSRNFGVHKREQFEELHAVLDALKPYLRCIVHGAYRTGADKLADDWAKANDIPVIQEHADWKMHGRGAGPKRNERMLRTHRPDMVLAFFAIGEGNKGTQNCIDCVKRLKMEEEVAVYCFGRK